MSTQSFIDLMALVNRLNTPSKIDHVTLFIMQTALQMPFWKLIYKKTMSWLIKSSESVEEASE